MRRMQLISRTRGQRSRESGQINIFLLLALGLFFLGFLGFAVDYANFWFHRRAAQAAADAACQAGAMDLLVNATNGNNALGGFPSPVADFDCATKANSGSAVCQYAALNGYPSATIAPNTPGTDVQVKFPASVSGVIAPPIAEAPTPFIQVNVEDDVQTFFSGLITGKASQPLGASATCGLQQAKAPIPIIVLNPTCEHPFEVSGSATLQIVGGPTKSVQVNSANSTCAAATDASANTCSGNGTIDLSKGGPKFTGSNFGTFGPPLAAPSHFNGGKTGSWISPASPIADPFANVAAPTVPPNAPAPVGVGFHIDGCPDNQGCTEYFPGKYTSPISVNGTTAIFVPGIYYIQPTDYSGVATGGLCGTPGSGCTAKPTGKCNADLLVTSGGVVRPAGTLTTPAAIAADDHSHGVVFYFSGSVANGFGSAVFTSSAGSAGKTAIALADGGPGCPIGGTRCIESMASAALTCDGSSADPSGNLGIPKFVDGDILVAQCTTKGFFIGGGSTDSVPAKLSDANRGMLFFDDRANGAANGQPNMQGGGGLAISGTIYAHNCPNSPSCDASTDYNAFLDLQGTPGSGTFVIGEIIADQLVEGGNGSIGMQLNPNAVFFILKAELLK
ncbi:MAG TPA: pilus assembly protein TadG-related protein [Candidatus Angelobacter sp.]|nr:pilus assembly protein TadG-related protein [Candidatus Angelobacter sp.]